ncbi:hypothetical protein LTR56_010863 [Elasticomyces elasticus]|nr:hypothetical protein LTR56_010863 [Elasticomyces elasticus]KAK3650264.1 hypothetical protein LTR22_012591 [Elasticomyces elasticus]KAK4911855.1 hypothetical protein LTR49_019655 [Elasticomyces elasticus]KAK5768283.1 hypothetical protein LTS12_001422 [Elasticomyces elasticus]
MNTLILLISMAAMLATALPAVDTFSKTARVSIVDLGVYKTTQSQDIHANIRKADTTTQRNSIPAFDGMCFNCGNGVDDMIAASVVDQFCNWANGIPMSAGVADGYQSAAIKFDYSNNAFSPSTGQVYLTVGAKSDEGCEGLRSISLDQCNANFRTIMDTCDVGSTDGKNGGNVDADCLRYTFQPNGPNLAGC